MTVLGLLSLGWSNQAFCYYSENAPGANSGNATSQMKGAACAPATARLTMDFNDVSAFIEQGGSMFLNRSTGVAAYEVPKGGGVRAIFSGSLWMGGTDVNGQLKLAGLTFRNGNDFWAGPLTISEGSGNYNPLEPLGDGSQRGFGPAASCEDVCLAYDRFFTIRKAEVIRYRIWWEACDPNSPVADAQACDAAIEPTNDELNRIHGWPAHVDLALIPDDKMVFDDYLAPFYDYDEDGHYDPDQGDYPWYDDILGLDDIECGVDRRVSLYGDVTHWWVFNDKGNIHTETNGDPIGMEVHAQAFAFATNDEVNRMTFYNYSLINRGTQTLFDTYFSQYIDGDLGNPADDYVGCDVSRGLGYMFNGDNFDEDGTAPGYGDNPPAIGVDFFEGPYQDADLKANIGPYYDTVLDSLFVPEVNAAIADGGIVYSGIGVGYGDTIVDNERFGMRRFTYYTNGDSYPYRDPANASEFYNFMSGNWADGSEMYYGGRGYLNSVGVTSIPSDYMFPGDSDPEHWATGGIDPGFDWDEVQSNSPAGDRRFVQSAGPFTLKPGAVNNITVGIVFGRSAEGGLMASVDAMKRADTKAQALFDACFRILEPPSAPKLTIQELNNQLILTLENPSSSNNYQEKYAQEDEINILDEGVDRFYRFEGYEIWQLYDETQSVSDIKSNIVNEPRLVAQCDLKNDISRIVNHPFDSDLEYEVAREEVDGENEGIRHSFLITEDAFALGDRALVNHKSYYYVAVAYAYNEFKPFDPSDPSLLDGQKMPYLASRLSYDGTAIEAVIGVPHHPMPEAGGTGQNIQYGSTPKITRIDGVGNGNRDLELTVESSDFILQNGLLDMPTYDYGKGPINVKVIDPLNVKGGYYTCQFRDYTPTNSNGTDGASWVIYRHAYENGPLLDSVTSDVVIRQDNEQLIPAWGVSVQIHQENYFIPNDGPGGIDAHSTDFITASIEYADSSLQWLSGVSDDDAFRPTNWIRSGDFTPITDPSATGYNCNPDVPDYYNPCNYGDQVGDDDDKVYAKLLNGTIAPHRLAGYQADFMPMAYYNYPAASTAKKNSSISFMPSVDIVLTSDKTKWTKCPVIELGRDPALNVGGAQPGQLRQSPSVDEFGEDMDDGTMGMGWFPGYAIDVESGVRLYMAFGENSFMGGENGSDMIWNPTDRLFDGVGTPIMGGMHPVYIYTYNTKTINEYPLGYDFPAYIPAEANNLSTHKLYQHQLMVESSTGSISGPAKREMYGSIGWVSYAMASPGYEIDPENLPTDVKIRIRVNKEYKNYTATGDNNGQPMYSWSMDDVRTETGSNDHLAEALSMINVVPNPYYAYSEYERSRLDTRVKITNLPERCTVSIFSVNGKLVRRFKKDNPVTSLDWDLNNHRGIPVAGGVYMIHVDVPGVGEKIVKFFGGMRQIDLQGI